MKKIFLLLLLILTFIIANVPVFGAQGDDQSTEVKPILIIAKDVHFTDVSGHWAEEVIYKMANKGIISGVGGGLFLPNKSMKRSEFASLIHKALGIQIAYFAATDITKTFKDVKNEDWYASALIDLVTANIIDDKNVFRPNASITREEMTHYVMNAFRYKGGIEPTTKDLPVNKFSDAKDIKAEYLNDINSALRLGFIKGKGNNLLVPKGLCTRAEVVTVVDRLTSALESNEPKNGGVSKFMGVRVDPSVSKSTEKFTMKVVISNDSRNTVTINHFSSQKYDFVLLDADKKEIYRWSTGRMFAEALTNTVIEPGKSVEFTEDLDIETYGDIVNKAEYLKAYVKGDSSDFFISPDGYETSVNH